MTKPQTRLVDSPSGLSSLKQYCLPGGASRLAALLLPQIRAVFSVVAPCHPGAALRNPVLLQRGQATRYIRKRLLISCQRRSAIVPRDKVETIEVHHLVPRGDEVTHELLPGIVRC